MTKDLQRIQQAKKRSAARAKGEHALDSAAAESHEGDLARTVEQGKQRLQDKAKAKDELKRM